MGNHLLIVVVHLLKLNGGRLTKTRVKIARTNIKVVNNTWIRAVCTDKAPVNAAFVRWRYYVTKKWTFMVCYTYVTTWHYSYKFWLHPKDQTDADKMLEDINRKLLKITIKSNGH